MAKGKLTRSRLHTRKGRFSVPVLDVVLGSASTKKRSGATVVARPFTTYLLLPHGSAKVDNAAGRLVDAGLLGKDDAEFVLRTAVLSAHVAGGRKIAEFNARDRAGHAAAAIRALSKLLKLVDDPSFISAILRAAPIVEAEHPIYGNYVRSLAKALDNVGLVEPVLVDQQRVLKPIRRQNPGRPYMAALVETLVIFWRKLTGELPSKNRIDAKRSKSLRVLFWHFADAAMADLSLKGEPISFQVRAAIDRNKKGVRNPYPNKQKLSGSRTPRQP